MTARLRHCFESLEGPALVIFITAGDPDPQTCARVLAALPGAGAHIIELGMPFSDPMAEGLPIQASSQRALAAGMTLSQTLCLLEDFRKENTQTPVILMGYTNPLHSYGFEGFARDAAAVGADGVLVVDMPPEEEGSLRGCLEAEGVCLIRLIAPTTPEARLRKILATASGFVYYVSVVGITGEKSPHVQQTQKNLQRVRRHTDLPIVVGFGLKTAAQLRALGPWADGVVVGSAVVEEVRATLGADGQSTPATVERTVGFVRSLREGLL